MSAEASARLRRLLAVLPLFADEREVSFGELTRRTGMNAEALLEDLSAITDRADVPGGFVETIGIELGDKSVAIRASRFMRPMRLTVPELCALELGVAMLRASSTPDEWTAIDRARKRIRELIVKLPLESTPLPWHAAAPAESDSPILATMRKAVATRHRVLLAYRGSGDQRSTERLIEPYGVISSHGVWYTAARIADGSGLRFFRLDRMESAIMRDDVFTIPDGFSLNGVLTSGRPFHSDATATMRVRYSPHIARWIAERESQPLDDDGSITITHQVADREWAVRHVLQYGPDAEVLEPASLRADISQRLTAMLA